jgi:hypothetical protein
VPIPQFDENGLLPPGLFDCTLPELKDRFGVFQGNDRRPRLFSWLEELLTGMRRSGMFESVLVDGSFVTAKSTPNDVDLIAVLPANHNFERELSMADYSLVSRTLLRRRFGFDVILARHGSTLYNTYMEFFSHVRDATHLRKGLLRLGL